MLVMVKSLQENTSTPFQLEKTTYTDLGGIQKLPDVPSGLCRGQSGLFTRQNVGDYKDDDYLYESWVWTYRDTLR